VYRTMLIREAFDEQCFVFDTVLETETRLVCDCALFYCRGSKGIMRVKSTRERMETRKFVEWYRSK
jgi:hypothetical protein